MWFPSFLLFLAFTSVIADVEDDFKQCADHVDIEELESIMNVKGRDQMRTVCPMMTNFFDCIDDVSKKHTGFTLEQLANFLADSEMGKPVIIVVNVKHLFEELCTEGSALNTDYLADADCFDTLNDNSELCKQKADEAYNVYRNFAQNVEEEAGDDDFDVDRDCMKLAYATACMASEIHDTCGRRAFNTFNTIVKRTTFFKNALCSEKGLQTLKTTFVDSLEMEESQKELYRLAFDFRKRRK